MNMKVAGKCLCGGIRFLVTPTDLHAHACHCDMCRKWSGAATLTVGCSAPPTIEVGQDLLATYKSSEWGERSFCKTCGSNLFHGAPSFGYFGVSAGALDDDFQTKLTMDKEVFIDKKPPYYSFEDTKQVKMTEAEFLAMVGGGGEGEEK
mmetsp:Transcript_39609/g.95669  ORF Transcript_39609/g.95669 Transcript_39609/m.95669 type:complete len:149 (-) Transcript_39609:136-582(-)